MSRWTTVTVAAVFGLIDAVVSAAQPAAPPSPPRVTPPAPQRVPPASARPSGTDDRVLIFFPPQPPRLWAPLPSTNLLSLRNAPPPDLAEYVTEPFYAPLGSRLRDDSLTAAQEEKLALHRREAAALRAEIRETLETFAEADLPARERALSELAARQAPRLAAHEARAEELREELIRSRDHWNAVREWRLGSTPFGTSGQAMAAQYQVLRAAAYYQKGLSPAQRRLLREIALDMENLVEMPLMGNELAPDANPLFAFSPETSRLRLPSPLSPEVAELITEYEREKATLKQELRDTIYEEDRTFLSFMRNARLEQLARNQAPRFAALEILAERIRKALAATRYRPTPPPGPSLPPAVVDLIDRYVERKNELEASVSGAIAAIQAVADLELITMTPSADGRFEVRIALRRGPRHDQQYQLVKDRLQAFNEAHAERLADLDGLLARARQSIVWLEGEGGEADEQADAEAGRTVEAYLIAMEQRQRIEKYHDYEIAVLEPGLSPEQRRLLFSSGVAHLDLPLPGGVPQPTSVGRARNRVVRTPSMPSVMPDRTLMGSD